MTPRLVINKRPVMAHNYNIGLVDEWLSKQTLKDTETTKELYRRFNYYHIGELGIKQFVAAIIFLKPKTKRVCVYNPKTQRMTYCLKGLNENS